MKKLIGISAIISLLVVLGCEQWALEAIAKIHTGLVGNIDFTTATVSGEIWGPSDENIVDFGHVWSSSFEEPTLVLKDDRTLPNGAKTLEGFFPFSSTLTELQPNTTYYVRAFVTLGSGESAYGETQTFKTLYPISTLGIDYEDGGYGFSLEGRVQGIKSTLTVGFCWSFTQPEPTLEQDTAVQVGSITLDPSINEASFALSLSKDLFPEGTKFHYRSYAVKNDGEVLYGNVLEWTPHYWNIWERKTDVLKNMAFHHGFGLGAKGYVLDDQYRNDVTKDIYEFDPSGMGSWRKLEEKYPGKGQELQSSFIIDYGDHKDYKAYVGLGRGTENSTDFWLFDPNGFKDGQGNFKGYWVEVESFGGLGRHLAPTFSINGKGYVVTGSRGSGTIGTDDVWEFDPMAGAVIPDIFDAQDKTVHRGRWTQKANYPKRIVEGNAFAIGNRGYMGVGRIWGGTAYSEFYEFDPNAGAEISGEFDSKGNPIRYGEWTPVADFLGGKLFFGISFVIDDKAYLGLGEAEGDGMTVSFWEFNPKGTTVVNGESKKGVWKRRNDFLGNVMHFTTGFSIPDMGRGYVVSGGPVGWLTYPDVWEYRPE
ncbi:MAG: fibronectin type III domain-containing protein [Saprospiraceae bacterium]|nr:fibronectin type III domain-containing protein [Lewinella sp.]